MSRTGRNDRSDGQDRPSNDDVYTVVDNWFAGLTKTNKVQGLELMFEWADRLMVGLPVPSLSVSSSPLQIAKAVMDAYYVVLAAHPQLAFLKVADIENNPLINPRLSDFVPIN